MPNDASELLSYHPEVGLQKIEHELCEVKGVKLYLLQLDQTHQQVSGNKWYKLKYNLRAAVETGENHLISFGGAYSNYIHALAWAGQRFGFSTTGVIRGEPEYAANATLSDARRWGMKLHFVNRRDYRQRHDHAFQQQLQAKVGQGFVIPEGGSNALAVKGCMEILSDGICSQVNPSHVVVPCGTGGTLTGLLCSRPDIKFLGIPVLKKADFLHHDIQQLISVSDAADPGNWSLDSEGHFGGYAKTSPELVNFIQYFQQQYGVELDQVYTAKMIYRLFQLIEKGAFPCGASLLAIHTGGLQGNRSLTGSPLHAGTKK